MTAAPALFLTATLALLTAILGLLVSLRRREIGVSYGDGGDAVLARRVRAHGNLVEYAPMAVLLVWGLGAAGIGSGWAWAAALILLAARLLHAAGVLRPKGVALRAAAMVAQHGVFILAALALLGALV